MSLISRIIKAIPPFIERPIPYLFFSFDRFYDFVFLPLMSKIWYLEVIMRGAELEKGLFLGRPVIKLYPGSKVTLEKDFLLISNQRRCSTGNVYAPCRIQTHLSTSTVFIGEGTSMNGASIVARSHSIHVGRKVMIGPNCVILDSPMHRLWPPEERLHYPETDLDQDIYIGDNCWIALGCVILPGSKIGENSVIGARSVVTGEIPPNSLAVGNPAKVIRRLDAK
jgi:acetyltransferase-like isoleucine patch superfamily enzyme